MFNSQLKSLVYPLNSDYPGSVFTLGASFQIFIDIDLRDNADAYGENKAPVLFLKNWDLFVYIWNSLKKLTTSDACSLTGFKVKDAACCGIGKE